MRLPGLLFALFVTAPLAYAQPRPLAFAHIEGEGGHAGYSVLAVARDAAGFLWAGTQGGLYRYDGVRTPSFGRAAPPRDSTTSSGLPDLYALALAPDVAVPGGMWIGTQAGGLARYDPRTGRFTHHVAAPAALPSDSVGALLTDHGGTLWVGTTGGGLARLTPGARGFERVRGLDPRATVRALLEPAPGVLWAGTTRGLARLDTRSGALTAVPLAPGPEGHVTALAAAGGAVWAATAGGALYRVEAATGRTTPFRPGAQLSALAASRAQPGVLWVGTRGQGLLAFDTRTGRATPAAADPALARADVLALTEDAAGLLWMGTVQGLYRADAAGPPFTPILSDPAQRRGGLTGSGVMALHEAPSEPGVLWVGTVRGGLNRLDRRTGAVRAYFTAPDHPLNVVFAIHEDRAGRLWLGGLTQEALFRFDRATGAAEALPLAPGSSGYVKQIYEAPSRPGVLWVATSAGGLAEFDPARGAVRRRFTTAGPPGARLPHGDVWTALEAADEPGVLWVGTNGGGLARLDVATGGVRRVEARGDGCRISDRVVALAAGPGSVLWLGTYDEGLLRYDRRAGTCRRYTRADGLPADAVGAVFVHDGYVWMSTSDGLARLDPAREAITTFTEADGLQGSEFYFHARGRTAAGEVLLGGAGGFNVFHPTAVRVDTTAPRVVLTRLLVDGEPAPLVREGDGLRPVRLPYNRNDLAFEFAALDLRDPSKNRYRVRLGAGAAWQHLGSRAEVRYPFLAPGRYTLEVVATNADGYWSRETTALAFVIRPPFWRAWWFWALVGAAVLGVVAGGYQYRIRQLVRLEQTRRRIADDLHDDIGSKVGAVALHLALAGRSAALPEAERERLAALAQAARGVVDDLRDAVWFVDAGHDDLPALVARMEQAAETMLRGRPHTFDRPDVLPQVAVGMEARRHLYLLFREALHNAVKHGGDGCVGVRVAYEGGRLAVEVADAGPGFDPAAATRGRGMATMRTRAEALGGDLHVESAPGRGTTVRFGVRLG